MALTDFHTDQPKIESSWANGCAAFRVHVTTLFTPDPLYLHGEGLVRTWTNQS